MNAIRTNSTLMIYAGMIVLIIIIEYSPIEKHVLKKNPEKISFMILLIIYITNVIQLAKHAVQEAMKKITIAILVLRIIYSLVLVKINMPWKKIVMKYVIITITLIQLTDIIVEMFVQQLLN